MLRHVMFLKVNFYILSLSLLFICFIIIDLKLPSDYYEFVQNYHQILLNNLLTILSILGLIYSIFAFLYFKYITRGATKISFKVIKIKNINYEYTSFLTSYIIPLIGLNLNGIRQLSIIVFLLVIIGIIYVKIDLFYSNPVLALFGFQIYKVDGSFKNNKQKNGIILISRGEIFQNDEVAYIDFGANIYFARKVAG